MTDFIVSVFIFTTPLFIFFLFKPRWGITRSKASIIYFTIFIIMFLRFAFFLTPEDNMTLAKNKQAEQAKLQEKEDEKNKKQEEQRKKDEKITYLRTKGKEIFKSIKITVDVQDTQDSKDNNKVVVWLKNESNYKISVDVPVSLKDAAKNTVDSETVRFENIEPNKGGFVIVWLKAKRVTSYEWELDFKDIKP